MYNIYALLLARQCVRWSCRCRDGHPLNQMPERTLCNIVAVSRWSARMYPCHLWVIFMLPGRLYGLNNDVPRDARIWERIIQQAPKHVCQSRLVNVSLGCVILEHLKVNTYILLSKNELKQRTVCFVCMCARVRVMRPKLRTCPSIIYFMADQS